MEYKFIVLCIYGTRSIPRALLRELWISGLRGMMMWTTKYLCVLLTWTAYILRYFLRLTKTTVLAFNLCPTKRVAGAPWVHG